MRKVILNPGEDGYWVVEGLRSACAALLVSLFLCAGCGKPAVTDEQLATVFDAIDEHNGPIPSYWPEDVPIIAGSKGISVFNARGCTNLTASVLADRAEIISYYRDQLTDDGWSLTANESFDEAEQHTYTRGEEEIRVLVGDRDIGDYRMLVLDYGPKGVDAWRDELRAMHRTPEAEAIISSMVETYATCASYRGKGTRSTDFSGASSHTNTLAFEIAFQRPDRFRLAVHEDGSLSDIVAADAGNAQYWNSTFRTIEQSKDVFMALGSSAETTDLFVPELLFGREPDPGEWDMGGWEVIQEGDVDGHPCHRVQGKNSMNGEVVLWIDKDTHLLRRRDVRSVFDTFETQEATRYEQEINPAIDDSEFDPQWPGWWDGFKEWAGSYF